MSSWQDNPLLPELTISRNQEAVISDQEKTRTKLSALKLNIFPSDTEFQAGSLVKGHFSLNCKSNKLKVKSIMAEIQAYESVTSESKKQQVHPIMPNQLLSILNADGPPTDGVAVDQPRSQEGYWRFKRGSFKFPFSFKLPDDVEGSVSLLNSDGIFYQVTLSVQYQLGSRAETLIKQRYVKVVSLQQDVTQNTPLESTQQVWGVFGGKGMVEMRGKLSDSIVGAGSQAHCQLSFKNFSKKSINKVTLKLIKRLKTFTLRPDGTFFPSRFYRYTENEVAYVAKDYDFSSESLVLRLQVPELTNPSITRGNMIQVTYAVQVLASAKFGKPLTIELPLTVVHPSCMVLSTQQQQEPDITTEVTESVHEAELPVIIEQVANKKVMLHQLQSDSAFQSQTLLPEVDQVSNDEDDFDAHLQALQEVAKDVVAQPSNMTMGRIPSPPPQLDPRVQSYVSKFQDEDSSDQEVVDDTTTIKAEIQSDGYHLKHPVSSQDAINQMHQIDQDDKELTKSLDNMFAEFLVN